MTDVCLVLTEGKDTVDCIMERMSEGNKTRGQIIRELKRQELITTAKDLKRPAGFVIYTVVGLVSIVITVVDLKL